MTKEAILARFFSRPQPPEENKSHSNNFRMGSRIFLVHHFFQKKSRLRAFVSEVKDLKENLI